MTYANRGAEFTSELAKSGVDSEWFGVVNRKRIVGDLAAMIFDAPPDQARQLLLRPTLEEALRSGDDEGLVALAGGHAGFWDVLTTIQFDGWAGPELERAADALSKYSDQDRVVVSGVGSELRKSVEAGVT